MGGCGEETPLRFSPAAPTSGRRHCDQACRGQPEGKGAPLGQSVGVGSAGRGPGQEWASGNGTQQTDNN